MKIGGQANIVSELNDKDSFYMSINYRSKEVLTFKKETTGARVLLGVVIYGFVLSKSLKVTKKRNQNFISTGSRLLKEICSKKKAVVVIFLFKPSEYTLMAFTIFVI